MKRRTIREWMNFMMETENGNDDKNELYGIQREGDLRCQLVNYKPAKEFFEIYSDYLGETVLNVSSKKSKEDNKNYCLFIIEKEELFDYTDKTEREILEHIFKKAEKRDNIHIQENRKYFIKILDRCENSGIGLLFDEKGNFISVESEY